ncbi:unnamed protein product [Urochloa humidicola]
MFGPFNLYWDKRYRNYLSIYKGGRSAPLVIPAVCQFHNVFRDFMISSRSDGWWVEMQKSGERGGRRVVQE